MLVVINQNMAKSKGKEVIEIFVLFGVGSFFLFFWLKTWTCFLFLCQVTLTIVNLHMFSFRTPILLSLKFLDKVTCFQYPSFLWTTKKILLPVKKFVLIFLWSASALTKSGDREKWAQLVSSRGLYVVLWSFVEYVLLDAKEIEISF